MFSVKSEEERNQSSPTPEKVVSLAQFCQGTLENAKKISHLMNMYLFPIKSLKLLNGERNSVLPCSWLLAKYLIKQVEHVVHHHTDTALSFMPGPSW